MSIMKETSGIACSSVLRLDGRVRWEIDAGTALPCYPFLEVLSLTTLCSCMPFLDVKPRLVFGKETITLKYQTDNRSKIRIRF